MRLGDGGGHRLGGGAKIFHGREAKRSQQSEAGEVKLVKLGVNEPIEDQNQLFWVEANLSGIHHSALNLE